MKRILSIWVILLAMPLIFAGCSKETKETAKAGDDQMKVINVAEYDHNGDGKVYACPSDGKVSDEPGKCESCGGELHEMAVEEAQEEIDEHMMGGGHEKMHEEEEGEEHESMHEDEDEENESEGKDDDDEHEAMNSAIHHHINVAEIDKNHDGKVFQCPMCADQIKDEKGECPKCGMALEETSVEKAKENLSKTKS